MKPNARFSISAGSRPHRRFAKWRLVPRYAALLAATCVSTGCEHDVALQNRGAGATAVCRESLSGFDPWSQKMACVSEHWTRSGQE